VKIEIIARTQDDAEEYVYDMLYKEHLYGIGLKSAAEMDYQCIDAQCNRVFDYEIIDEGEEE